MSLPVFQHIHLKSSQLEEIQRILNDDMNLRHPVAIHIKTLDVDQQREVTGVIENFFISKNISFKYPYPIYLVTDLDSSISNMPIAKNQENLPKFFIQKDTKMNVKEMHLAAKNKLLQQEVKNSDAAQTVNNLEQYSDQHRKIHQLDLERQFYSMILNKLARPGKNG